MNFADQHFCGLRWVLLLFYIRPLVQVVTTAKQIFHYNLILLVLCTLVQTLDLHYVDVTCSSTLYSHCREVTHQGSCVTTTTYRSCTLRKSTNTITTIIHAKGKEKWWTLYFKRILFTDDACTLYLSKKMSSPGFSKYHLISSLCMS